MNDTGHCQKHDNFHAHCQRCCMEERSDLRARAEHAEQLLRVAMEQTNGILRDLTKERDESRNRYFELEAQLIGACIERDEARQLRDAAQKTLIDYTEAKQVEVLRLHEALKLVAPFIAIFARDDRHAPENRAEALRAEQVMLAALARKETL